MKKLLLAASALGLATGAMSAPAQADTRSQYEQRHDNGKHRGHYKQRWNDPRYYDNNWDRRYRGSSYYHWRYFYRYPTYIYGRCDRRWNVVVRDPYTMRYVCMPRYEYDRYRLEIRINI